MTAVWITGAHGFVGQHLAVVLSDRGAVVGGVGHGAWTADSAGVSGVRHWMNGEVSHSNLNLLASRSGLPEAVYHLAGGSAVGASLVMPAEDFQRSVVSTSAVLEWVRQRSPATRVILASSAAVYGSSHERPISEEGEIDPYSPYGYNKRSAELLFRSYAHNFGLSTAVVRLFSVYGVGLRKQLLWDLCGQLRSGFDRITLGGSGNEVRDFINVRDAVGSLMRADELASSSCFVLNAGTGWPRTVRDVATDLCDAWGTRCIVEFTGIARAGDPRYLVADTSRAVAVGCEPGRDWCSGLVEYVTWYRQNAI